MGASWSQKKSPQAHLFESLDHNLKTLQDLVKKQKEHGEAFAEFRLLWNKTVSEQKFNYAQLEGHSHTIPDANQEFAKALQEREVAQQRMLEDMAQTKLRVLTSMEPFHQALVSHRRRKPALERISEEGPEQLEALCAGRSQEEDASLEDPKESRVMSGETTIERVTTSPRSSS